MLRVLQSGEFERVGGGRPLKTDVRVIAASNRDLEQAVREGRFRSDLYHRLAIFPIHLPPLRERREDIPLLAAYLMTRKAHRLGRKIERIPNAVLDRLRSTTGPATCANWKTCWSARSSFRPAPPCGWRPSNWVRSPATARDARIHGRHRSRRRRPTPASARAGAHPARLPGDRLENQGPGWRRESLGLNPGTLYSRMKKLGIQRPAIR